MNKASVVVAGKRHDRERTRRLLAIDGDALLGTDKDLEKTNTYIIDKIDGELADRLKAANSRNRERLDLPVFYVCDQYNSLLIMNSLYSKKIDVPIRDDPDAPPERIHMFSAFHSTMEAIRTDLFVYEWPFGGVTDCGPDPNNIGESLYMPRPAAMCFATQELMNTIEEPTFAFGWRSLLYERRDAADPWLTGLVALEGWLFQLVDSRWVDVTDPNVLAVYMQRIVDRSQPLLDKYRAMYGGASDAPPEPDVVE